MSKLVSVFCSSSDVVSSVFFETAREFGALLAQSGATLYYGGEDVGLMGAVARSVKENGGRVVGIITERMKAKESVNFSLCDDMLIARSFQERKELLTGRADVFVSLPGGYGTLDETFDVINRKQLGEHNKPIVIINAWGYYDQLEQFLKAVHAERFSSESPRSLYSFVRSAADAMDIISSDASERQSRR